MRRVLCWSVWTAFLIGSASAGTIQYDVNQISQSALGQNVFQINYTVSGFSFSANQELAIQYDPAIYLALSNGIVSNGFNWVVLQPNNPPGASGQFSILSMVNNPSMPGRFSISVSMLNGAQPGAQAFAMNQLSQGGVIETVLDSGVTVPSSVPEPATFAVAGLALLAGGAFRVVRDQLKRAA